MAGAAADTLPLRDPDSHFGAGRQDIESVLRKSEQPGIPTVL